MVSDLASPVLPYRSQASVHLSQAKLAMVNALAAGPIPYRFQANVLVSRGVKFKSLFLPVVFCL